MTQWQGKKWYCYGTSMSSNQTVSASASIGKKPNGEPNTGARMGWYSTHLASLSGLIEHNFAKGGFGIVPAVHGADCNKDRVMRLSDGKAEADLITVEVIPNDFGNAPLGTITDLGDETFCGNLNQMLAYLLENTKACIVVLIASRPRYLVTDPSETYTPTGDLMQEHMLWEKAVEDICRMHGVPCLNGAAEANLGYHRVKNTTLYLQDQIHLTEKGGKALAQYFWGKLQTIYPQD